MNTGFQEAILLTQSLVHLIESIAIQVNVDVVGDIYIGMSEQLGKNLDVHALVIAVCSERMPKDMFASVLNPCIAARALRLPSQSLVLNWSFQKYFELSRYKGFEGKFHQDQL